MGKRKMITLRKRLAGNRARSMLLPALLFLGSASFSAVGGSSLAVLCLLPAGIAAEHALRDGTRKDHAS
ncbi:MAG: hypothetical protein AAFY29_00230 [Pseudomonadota bacterium]